MGFLPKDYEVPTESGLYMKFQDGENRIRIISSPIIGWEDWENNKPIRFRMNNKPEKAVDSTKPIRHFWAFLVWNYHGEKIQILQITQKMILTKLQSLARDMDWGAPFTYDLKIEKSGQDKMTKYDVKPVSPKPVDPKIKQAFYERPIDIEELFNGGDPLHADQNHRTKAFWEEEPEAPKLMEENLSQSQVDKIESEIELWIAKDDPNWKASLLSAFKVSSVSQIKKKHFEAVLKRIEDKKTQLIDDNVPF